MSYPGVVQKLADGDGAGVGQCVEPRAIPEMGGQEVGARQRHLALQRQNGRRDEGLADTRGRHRCIGRHGAVALDIGQAGGRQHHRAIRQGDRRRGARKTVTLPETVQRRRQSALLRRHGRREAGQR